MTQEELMEKLGIVHKKTIYYGRTKQEVCEWCCPACAFEGAYPVILAEGRRQALMQEELAEWQAKNFKGTTTDDMILGMVEELGELAHCILKRKQGIRNFNKLDTEEIKAKIGDAFADVVIYGIQAMTKEGIDAVDALRITRSEVMKRDWVNNPGGDGYSQHKVIGNPIKKGDE